jgi:ABC-type amino acid transport substrate-binding protein
LDAGLIDAVFNDRLNTLVYMQEHPNVRIQGEVFDPAGLGISVKTGDTELLNFINQSLARMQESGEIQQLFNTWINPQTSSQ